MSLLSGEGMRAAVSRVWLPHVSDVPKPSAVQMVSHGAHEEGGEYLAPAFKFDEEEHRAVLQEAAAMDRVLSGHQARAEAPA